MTDTEQTAGITSEDIDAGVNAVMAEIEADREADGPTDNGDEIAPAGGGASEEEDDNTAAEGDDASADADDDDASDAVTDEHLEKAVQAGLSMAEARQFGSASHLQAVLARLEAAGQNGEAGSGDNGGSETPGSDGEDPLAGMPDLDPEEYDENIVKGFAAMKEIVRTQHETIRQLSKRLDDGPSATNADWLTAQVAGLEKPVATAIQSDPTKLEAIRQKISVLAAGYDAAGQDVSREAVFQEAVHLAAGDVIAKAREDKLASQLKRRAGQHVNRPSGHREAPKGDPLVEVGREMDQKYFGQT